MLSDITFKYSAVAELAIYNKFRQFAGGNLPRPVVILSAMGVCIADIFIDTVKFPIAVIENLAFAILNIGGAACVKECRCVDARQNMKKAVIGLFVATPFAGLAALPKLFGHLCVTLTNPTMARPFNREAMAESRMKAIIFPSRELQEIVSANSFVPV